MLSTSNSSKSEESTISSAASAGAAPPDDEKEEPPPPPIVVYESPLGGTVARLRFLSLMTMLSGVIGVPCVLAVKGVVPEFGMLATAMTFVSATSASTAAVNFVFRPYIYSMTAIPVRQCSYNNKTEAATAVANEDGTEQDDSVDNKSADSSFAASTSTQSKKDNDTPKPKKETLLKAVTKNLFFRKVEVVFNPETDVELYKGLRPLCNFEAKGVPLYVHSGTLFRPVVSLLSCPFFLHPVCLRFLLTFWVSFLSLLEYVNDARLRKAMKLDKGKKTVNEKNPDDELL